MLKVRWALAGALYEQLDYGHYLQIRMSEVDCTTIIVVNVNVKFILILNINVVLRQNK